MLDCSVVQSIDESSKTGILWPKFDLQINEWKNVSSSFQRNGREKEAVMVAPGVDVDIPSSTLSLAAAGS